MTKTLDEIKQDYDNEINRLLSINALKLPTGRNNIYTLVYLPFFESKNLSIIQKGMLIQLFIRGGNNRIVLKSSIKLSKTLGIHLSTYSKNLKKLEEMSYIKKYMQKVDLNVGTLSDIIYVNPIDDKTGLPIKSNDEEIQLSLDAAKEYLNKYSEYLIKIQEKSVESNDNSTSISDLDDKRLEIEDKIKKALNQNIFIPSYIAFMENPLLSLADKVIYLYLALRGGENSVVFENKETLASKLNISYNFLMKSINKLEELQYIKKFKRQRSTGEYTSDVLYINSYDKFNGLPEIDDDVMDFKISRIKELYFNNDILKSHVPKISKEKQNEVFSSNLKSLLILDNNITEIAYDTFILDSSFEQKDDLVIMNIPDFLNSLKETIYEQYNEYIIKYTKAILQSDKDFKLTIKVNK